MPETSDKLVLELTEEQTRLYNKFVDDAFAVALEEDDLGMEVTISFTFTPVGRSVVAFYGGQPTPSSIYVTLEDCIGTLDQD